MSTYQGNADRYNRIYNKLYGNGPVLPGLAQGFKNQAYTVDNIREYIAMYNSEFSKQ